MQYIYFLLTIIVVPILVIVIVIITLYIEPKRTRQMKEKLDKIDKLDDFVNNYIRKDNESTQHSESELRNTMRRAHENRAMQRRKGEDSITSRVPQEAQAFPPEMLASVRSETARFLHTHARDIVEEIISNHVRETVKQFEKKIKSFDNDIYEYARRLNKSIDSYNKNIDVINSQINSISKDIKIYQKFVDTKIKGEVTISREQLRSELLNGLPDLIAAESDKLILDRLPKPEDYLPETQRIYIKGLIKYYTRMHVRHYLKLDPIQFYTEDYGDIVPVPEKIEQSD